MDEGAQSVLILAQTVTINMKVESVQQSLALLDSGRCNIAPAHAANQMFLNSAARVQKTVALSVQSELTFAQDAQPRVNILSISQNLITWQGTEDDDLFPLVTQQLSLSSVATVVKAKGITQTLVITSLAEVEFTRTLSVSSILAMSSSAVGYNTNECL